MTSPIDFDPTLALPNVAYRDEGWFEAELESIWHGDWVFVTTEDALANPGDQLPVMVGRQPVLLLRNQDGQLVALSNLCAHRGTLLVEEPSNGKRIQCPYHAWTYADSGKLLSVPFSPKGEVTKADHCLPSYRVESWHGLVFVCLNSNVEPLSERFAVIDETLAVADLDAFHHWSSHWTRETWECNWKLAILNAMENYHLFQVHSETLEPITPTKDGYYIAGSARATITGNLATDGSTTELISLAPGFVGVASADSLVWVAVDPIAHDKCTIRTGGAFTTKPPDPSAGRLTKWMTNAGMAMYAQAFPDFLPEDKEICERGQRGAIGDYVPGPLIEAERIVRDFGHYLNWKLNKIDPPPVYRSNTERTVRIATAE